MNDPMTDEEYLRAGGNRCPFCGSNDIEARSGVETEGMVAHQEIFCLSCDAEWFDLYNLVGWDPPLDYPEN